MKKGFRKYFICWLILLALFNVVCFVTPTELAGYIKFGGAFWAGYICITLACIAQLVCAYIALKAENAEKLFYNLPLVTVSYTGLILTVIAGAVCIAIPDVPNWVGILVCALILAVTAIAVIKASSAAELVSETEQKVKAKTACIRMLTVDAENLLSRAQNAEAKAACKKVFEAVRYSDPVSSEALTGIEEEISQKFAEFSETIKSGTPDDAITNELLALIGDRNRKCKALK